MWLYEIEDSITGFVRYAWVSDTGSVIEQYVPNNYPPPNPPNSQASQSAGLAQRPNCGGFGGGWMDESRSGSVGIAETTDKVIVQLYERANGPEENDIPSGYLLAEPSFITDLMKAWILHRERVGGEVGDA
jgi:hypothetical protein